MNRLPGPIAVAALLWCGAAPAAAQATATHSAPNILLIVSEDNGPDLGCYGDPFAVTPNLDRLAADGVRFANAFVPYSVCSPSRAAFLTGLHPQQSGQIGLATHDFQMLRAFPNLPGLLKATGYRTGLIGKLHVNPESAFPFDFRRYNGSNFRDRKVRKFAAAAAEFFGAGDEPFFLSINYADAHFPLIRQQDGLPEEPLDGDDVRPLGWVGADSPRLREFTADYYNCLARLDAGVGLLLDALDRSGRAEDTLVIYIGDHGAQFSRGKTSCYDAALRVPLIVRWPGRTRRAEVRDELTSTLDIVPTICAAAGIEPPANLTGRALQPLLTGGVNVPWRDHVFAMGTGSAPALAWLQFAVRSAGHKLIVNPQVGDENRSARAYLEQLNVHFAAGTTPAEIAAARPLVQQAYATWLRPPAIELYDLDADPHEFVNLADRPEVAAVQERLLAELAAFRASIADPFVDPDLLADFVAEQAAARVHPYRAEKGFRWSYVDAFREWTPDDDGEPGLAFAAPFTHHTVLPRDVPIPVWGTAPAGTAVTVALGDARAEAIATDDGHWRAVLDAQRANATPRSLVVTSGARSVRCLDVVVGDIWLCAGQSNMAFPLERSTGATDALEHANRPDLRLWNHTSRIHPGGKRFPLELLRSVDAGSLYESDGWSRSDATTAAGFSAVAWRFGARLAGALDVPIGLAHVAVGGSPIESWIPRATMEADPELLPLLGDWLDNPAYPAWCQGRARLNLSEWLADPTGTMPHHPFEPTFLFDAGVAPLVGLPIRGVVWYQGESNATRDGGLGPPIDPAVNAHKIQALVDGWRTAFDQPALPFLMVQLPGLNREWPAFRDAQARVARADPHVHLAVTIDVGHPTDVHPRQKAPVGDRLARLALAHVHSRDVDAAGPAFTNFEADTGGVIRVRFDDAVGLRTTDGAAPLAFAVAGTDGRFHAAAAAIDGETVRLHCAAVSEPVAVRYAWQNDPRTNLVDGEGLPAAPFRSDDWPVRAKIRVACIGDSITFGTGIADRRTASYPARLEELLGPDYAVRNCGRPGAGVVERSLRGDRKRAFVFAPEHRAALAWQPDIVVCNLGINDVMDWDRYGRTDLVGDYRKLIAAYRALPTRPTILLWTPLAPLFEGQRFHGDPDVTAIDTAITRVAQLENLTTLDLRTPLVDHPEWFAHDHIHPNADGARAIAEAVARAVEAIAH